MKPILLSNINFSNERPDPWSAWIDIYVLGEEWSSFQGKIGLVLMKRFLAGGKVYMDNNLKNALAVNPRLYSAVDRAVERLARFTGYNGEFPETLGPTLFWLGVEGEEANFRAAILDYSEKVVNRMQGETITATVHGTSGLRIPE